MASAWKTDRRQLDRLLDPENKSVTLSTLRRAATALGWRLGEGGKASPFLKPIFSPRFNAAEASMKTNWWHVLF
jgi:hypothetical protein